MLPGIMQNQDCWKKTIYKINIQTRERQSWRSLKITVSSRISCPVIANIFCQSFHWFLRISVKKLFTRGFSLKPYLQLQLNYFHSNDTHLSLRWIILFWMDLNYIHTCILFISFWFNIWVIIKKQSIRLIIEKNSILSDKYLICNFTRISKRICKCD